MLSCLIFLSLLHTAIACSSDNCLRALQHNSATGFCLTYTTATSTATTSLPTYATACANSPSRLSSACSCLITAPPTPTCTPSFLKNPTFTSGGAGWAVGVNEAPTQTVAPEYKFGPYGSSGGDFQVAFPNFQPDPFLASVLLYQSQLTICNGIYTIGFQYIATINAIAAGPVPEESNCTITTGFDGFASSFLVTDVPWVTTPGTPASVDYQFTISDLTNFGDPTAFELTIQCPMADWWPEVVILNPFVNISP